MKYAADVPGRELFMKPKEACDSELDCEFII